MNELNKLAKFKPESFLEKVIKKIKGLFKKEESNDADNENIYAQDIIIPENVSRKEKDEFLEIYNKVKNDGIDVETVDETVLYRIMVMLNEELATNSRKIEDKTRLINISINNLKAANSRIQLLKKVN